MTDAKNERLRRLFDLASELAGAARDAFLDAECGGDGELRRRLVAMLAAAEDKRFLASPTGSTIVAAEPVREGPGTRIGPYKLLQQIGEGGFGVVFMAEQEKPVARRVALKIIKLGMDTRQVVARFEQERQALALMDHPNIARVIDAAATDTGRPYFVMDLVKGEPIAKYCDEHHLPIDARLELFSQVCNAVQHAHQKGIIHRDIKPSNVLVSTHDGKPLAKVIDFGIAKATSSKLTDKTLFTEHEQVIGTLQYMSPEQAQGSLDIDTRTDVYSLGVVLYELLTGSTPFDKQTIRGAMVSEIHRMIREVDPPKPSTRLSQSADVIASIAAQRGVEPRRLGAILRGELDWIVMKALEKDRTRRYESANDLAMDIRRHLGGEPVVAAPPSASYRLRKFVGRNKSPVAAGAAVAAALLAGVIGFAWQAAVAREQRDRAVLAEGETRKRADELQKVSDFQAGMLEQVDPTVAGQLLSEDVTAKFTTALEKAGVPEADRTAQVDAFRSQWSRVNETDAARELIDRTILRPAVEAIEKMFADQPLVAAKLRATLAERYRRLGLHEPARALLQSAVDARRRWLGDEHEDTLDAIENLCIVLRSLGQFAEAEPLQREVLATSRRVLGEEHPQTLQAIRSMGDLLYAEGKRAEAEASYREALSKLERVLGALRPATLTAKDDLGTLLYDQNRLAEAEPLLRQALEGRRTVLGEDARDTLATIDHLASLLAEEGKLSEAEPLERQALAGRRRVLGEEHPETLMSINNLGCLLQRLGRPSEAEAMFRQALDGRRRRFGSEHPDTLIALSNLGLLLKEQGRFAEAEPLMRDALEKRRRLLGEDHPDTLTSINNLGLLLHESGTLAEAEALCREALGKQRRVLGEEHPETLGSINNLGTLLKEAGKPAEAEPFIREAMEKLQRVAGEEHPYSMSSIANLAVVLQELGRFDEAERYVREAIEKQRRVLGGEHPSTLNSIVLLGYFLSSRGRQDEAVTLLASNEPAARKASAGGNVAVLARLLMRLGSARAAVAKSPAEFAAAERNLLEAQAIFYGTAQGSAKDSRNAAQAFVDLYAAWDQAEPGTGHDAKCAEWKAKQEAIAAPATEPKPGEKQ